LISAAGFASYRAELVRGLIEAQAQFRAPRPSQRIPDNSSNGP
jgi:hypothetical protein